MRTGIERYQVRIAFRKNMSGERQLGYTKQSIGTDDHNRFSHAGCNIITDMAIAILPLPMLKQLQIPRGQKTVLMAVFALGGL